MLLIIMSINSSFINQENPIEKIKKAIEKQNIELLNYWEATPPYMLLSSKKKIGRKRILTYISEINNSILK